MASEQSRALSERYRRTNARRFAERARAARVEVEPDVFADQQHTFQMMAGRAPEADEAIARLAGRVRPHLGLDRVRP